MPPTPVKLLNGSDIFTPEEQKYPALQNPVLEVEARTLQNSPAGQGVHSEALVKFNRLLKVPDGQAIG